MGSPPRRSGSPDCPVGLSRARPGFVGPPLREAERRTAQTLGHLARVPRLPFRAGAPSGAPPWRFFTTAPRRMDRVRRPQSVADLHPIASATEGGPLIGGGRCRRTLGRGYVATPAGRHTPLHQPNVSGRRPQRAGLKQHITGTYLFVK